MKRHQYPLKTIGFLATFVVGVLTVIAIVEYDSLTALILKFISDLKAGH